MPAPMFDEDTVVEPILKKLIDFFDEAGLRLIDSELVLLDNMSP